MDKSLYPLKGIVPIINTPFTDRNTIDYDSVKRLIEQGIKDGIVGCIVPAVASEVSQLSDSERKEFAEKVCKHLDMSLGSLNCSKFADGEIQITINEM